MGVSVLSLFIRETCRCFDADDGVRELTAWPCGVVEADLIAELYAGAIKAAKQSF